MFAEIDLAICRLIEEDGRLLEGLDSVPVVINSLPYPRDDVEYQVWVFEGDTSQLGYEYRKSDPPVGEQDGVTPYTVLCRVRALDSLETLYARTKQLRHNVYRILRDVPTGDEEGGPWFTALWGAAAITRVGGVIGQGRPGATASAAASAITFAVEWEDQFVVGE